MRNECQRLERWLHEYAEGWLAAPEQARVQRHLQHCLVCQQRLRAWRTVSDALRNLPRLEAPAPVAMPAQEAEPHTVLRFALGLCLPVALWLTVFSSPPRLPALTTIAPYEPLIRLTTQLQTWLLTFWSWLQGML